ncbi:MAG TPA: DUF5615 family PIN-like protein [Firmicutes bacterium]|nr:DUF5615 family PIN-like protein [Bacillota bacterium]
MSQLAFLADESWDFAVVRALRGAGYDVLAALETCRGADDEYLIELACGERRVLITEDRDFGRLVYAAGVQRIGVIYPRFPTTARGTLCQVVVSLIREHGDNLAGAFVVVQPGRVRIRRLT